MNGLLNVLKPPGMTSSDVIVYIRKLLGEKKVGHAGTLDPGAAGVLPICIGRATRLFDYLVDKEKEYIAEITLGIETDTQDQYGMITAQHDVQPDGHAIRQVISEYKGSIMQKPPMFSAIKYKGRKLYDLAREGSEVEVVERQIHIYSIDVLKQNTQGSWLLKIRCSRGTYIRTICHDIGHQLGCGAYMSLLVRTGCGPFAIQDAYTLEQFKDLFEKGMIDTALLPMDHALQEMGRIDLTADEFSALRNGRPIHSGIENELTRLYYNGDIVGVGQAIAGECRIKTFLMQV